MRRAASASASRPRAAASRARRGRRRARRRRRSARPGSPAALAAAAVGAGRCRSRRLRCPVWRTACSNEPPIRPEAEHGDAVERRRHGLVSEAHRSLTRRVSACVSTTSGGRAVRARIEYPSRGPFSDERWWTRGRARDSPSRRSATARSGASSRCRRPCSTTSACCSSALRSQPPEGGPFVDRLRRGRVLRHRPAGRPAHLAAALRPHRRGRVPARRAGDDPARRGPAGRRRARRGVAGRRPRTVHRPRPDRGRDGGHPRRPRRAARRDAGHDRRAARHRRAVRPRATDSRLGEAT